MDDNLQAELERLRAENARLKRDRGRTVSLKVSEKGGVSVYGLGRFPVTLYKEQWITLLAMTDEIRAFLTEHDVGTGPEPCGDDHARHLGQCDRKHGDFPLITTRCITACSPPTAVQRQQLTQDFVVGDVAGRTRTRTTNFNWRCSPVITGPKKPGMSRTS